MKSPRTMKLGLSMRSHGYFPSAWLDTSVPADAANNLPFYIEMTKAVERGLFDMVFLADHGGMIVTDEPKGALGRLPNDAGFEPLSLLAALSQHTQHVGLAATVSTTFHEPYALARQLASLDQLSGGRMGWNVVTSSRDSEAQNFNMDRLPPKDRRYARAREMLQVSFGLWDSWDDDAFLYDRKARRFFDPAKMHLVDHVGEFFKVKGPLLVPRSPQGRPVIILAGGSSDAMSLAADMVDIVFTLQTSFEDAKAFYQQIKEGASRAGRAPDDVKVLPGVLAVVGDTMAEADEKYQTLQSELDPVAGLHELVRYFGDLSGHDIDGPVPELRTDIPVVNRGTVTLELARKNNWSIRQLYQHVAIGHSHHVVVGTPAYIADVMEQWFLQGAADGFNVLPAKSPVDVLDFVNKVVPELQKRKLYRTHYEGRTLRENLGLPQARSKYS